MFCPECKRAGKKSKVYPGTSSTTLVYYPPFYDEEGSYHHHDANVTTTDFWCSNGHAWMEQTQPRCWCGWPEKGT